MTRHTPNNPTLTTPALDSDQDRDPVTSAGVRRRGRPRKSGDYENRVVRLPAALNQRLKTAAEQRDVSANVIVNRAIENYLNQIPPINELLPVVPRATHTPNVDENRLPSRYRILSDLAGIIADGADQQIVKGRLSYSTASDLLAAKIGGHYHAINGKSLWLQLRAAPIDIPTSQITINTHGTKGHKGFKIDDLHAALTRIESQHPTPTTTQTGTITDVEDGANA